LKTGAGGIVTLMGSPTAVEVGDADGVLLGSGVGSSFLCNW
jgi:hypothetical protein